MLPILLLAPKRLMDIGTVAALQMIQEVREEHPGIMRLLRIQGNGALGGRRFRAFQQTLEGQDPVPHPGIGAIKTIPTLIK